MPDGPVVAPTNRRARLWPSGRTADARQLLDRLRQLRPQDLWNNDADSQTFLRQAESLIEPRQEKPSQ